MNRLAFSGAILRHFGLRAAQIRVEGAVTESAFALATAARKIRELLSDRSRAEAIRHAGLARALRDHSCETGFARAFGLLGLA